MSAAENWEVLPTDPLRRVELAALLAQPQHALVYRIATIELDNFNRSQLADAVDAVDGL